MNPYKSPNLDNNEKRKDPVVDWGLLLFTTGIVIVSFIIILFIQALFFTPTH